MQSFDVIFHLDNDTEISHAFVSTKLTLSLLLNVHRDEWCAQENGGCREKEKEKMNGGGKKEREHSESDNSWSSVDEIESKEMADKSMEEDNFETIEEETEAEKCNQLRRKSKTIRKPDVPQDCKETAQRRPLLTSSS